MKNTRDKKLKFTDIFMLFVDMARPQNAKLCDSCEHEALNMNPQDYPGGDTVKMAEFA